MQAINFFVPTFEALVGGYAVLLVSYMVLGFLVTRLGRRILMAGDRVSVIATILFCLVWFTATFAACYVCSSFAPIPPEGPIGFPLVLTGLALLLVGRRFRHLPDNQSLAITACFIVMILAGTAGALCLKLGIPLHHSL